MEVQVGRPDAVCREVARLQDVGFPRLEPSLQELRRSLVDVERGDGTFIPNQISCQQPVARFDALTQGNPRREPTPTVRPVDAESLAVEEEGDLGVDMEAA